jgi:hypothetical protein
MKKVLMLVAAVAITTAGFAQKFESGDKNLEVNFAPLGGAPISINNIKLRLFNTDASAFRLGFGLTLANEKTVNGTTTDGKTTMFNNESTFNFSIRPGYEMHFEGTDRLSPYWGAELDFAIQTHSVEDEYENTPAAVNSVETTTTTGTDGYVRFGVNVLAGFDYYFADKLYLGSEIGFGFGIVSNSDIERDNTITGFEAPDAQEQGSTMNLGPNFNGAIRLGFCF